MKYIIKLILIILIFNNAAIIAQSTKKLSKSTVIEVSKCDIQIDQGNTKVYKNRDDNFILKTIIRHDPPFGNDDDAWGVKVNIVLPNNTGFIQTNEHSIQSQSVGQSSFNGNVVTIQEELGNGIHLPRAEHMDIEIEVDNPCTEVGQVFEYKISAYPSAPNDIDHDDNEFTLRGTCKAYHLSTPTISENSYRTSMKLIKDLNLPQQEWIRMSPEMLKLKEMLENPEAYCNGVCFHKAFSVCKDLESWQERAKCIGSRNSVLRNCKKECNANPLQYR